MLLGLLISSAAVAGDATLTLAKSQYRALDFEGCVATLESARRQGPSVEALVETELYLGLCHFSAGSTASAVSAFRATLALDPAAQLPPYTSPKAVDLFVATANALTRERALLRPEPTAATRALASSLELSSRSPPEAVRPRSLLWPLSLGGVGLAGIGTSVAFGLSAKELEGAANRAHFQTDADALASQARPKALIANVALGVGLTALVGAALVLLLPEGP